MLHNRSIVITGASSGIGAATARLCAREGMDVVLGGRRAERLEALAQEIRSTGRRAEIVAGDVADPRVTPRLLDAAIEKLGGLYAVFANAGYGFEMATVDVSSEALRRIFEVNFFSSAELIRAAARHLIDHGQPGHLLMCSSCLARFTLPRYAAYCATKAAQTHTCRALRVELAAHRIEVSVVHPITTRTEFFLEAQRHSGRVAEHDVPDHTPSLFVQPPERVARAVVRCLRRPKPEVWTSTIVRATAAMMTLSPGFAELIMRRVAKGQEKSRN